MSIESTRSLKDIETNFENSDTPTWAWDNERKRIIWANKSAVTFWQELSVLDLLDTLFTPSHPIAKQFSKAQSLSQDTSKAINMSVDFTSIDIEQSTNCQFEQIKTTNNRTATLIQVTKASEKPQTDTPDAPTPETNILATQILDNAPVALALFNTDGKFNYANQTCQEIFTSADSGFLKPNNLSDWFTQDEDKKPAENLIKKCLKYGIVNLNANLTTSFGDRNHSIVAKSLTLNISQNNNSYILVCLRDVADERNYEKTLTDRIAKLEALEQNDITKPAELIEDEQPELTTSELEFTTLETNLSDTEAVNFASLAQTLNAETEPTTEVKIEMEDEAEIEMEDEVEIEIEAETQAEDEAIADTSIADNIVPAFGATPENIAKFGRNDVDMFKLILDQTPVSALVSTLPTQDGITLLFANKEVLHTLGLIENKDDKTDIDTYYNLLSIEAMEDINTQADAFGDTPIEQEISLLVNDEKHYFNAKINKINWQGNKALQYFLSPKHSVATPQPLQAINNDTQNNNVVQFNLDGQAFIDENQQILSSNTHLSKLINTPTDTLNNSFIGDIVTPEHLSMFQDYLFSVLQNNNKNLSLDGVEVDLIGKDDGKHSTFIHIKRLTSDEAKNFPSDILVNIQDINRWKKKEKNLRDAKERAEQENVQKSGFLARISHELRTPLNAIIGFSEVMSDEKFGPLENSRYKGYAHDINESGTHLLSLINDLLDLSKIDAGKVELNFKAIELEPIILQSVALMQPMADKKRIIIRNSISDTLPQIIADMRSIRQIILNLLSNSIKYSDAGSQVIISALLNDDGEVLLRVRDTGIGMDEKQLESAMEPFKTLDMSTLVDKQGTGLGLPLTKALSEANRANFSIQSAIGSGTLVQITFPTTRVLN